MSHHQECLASLEIRLPEALPVLGIITWPVELPEDVRILDITKVALHAMLPRDQYRFPLDITVTMPVCRTTVLVTLATNPSNETREGMTPGHSARRAFLRERLERIYFPAILSYVHTHLARVGLAHDAYPHPCTTHPANLVNEYCPRVIAPPAPADEHPSSHFIVPSQTPWRLLPSDDPTYAISATASWRRYSRYHNLAAAAPYLCELVQPLKEPRATITYRSVPGQGVDASQSR